ncbi:MAG: ATP-binding protein, partial [Natronosporangium sp.]
AVDGLVGTLRARVSLLDRVHDATVTLDPPPPELPPLSGPAEETLLRVAEEALHNALRHAGATAVRVSLTAAADQTVTLVVTDDGVGFDVDAPRPAAARRLGLASMRERARVAGGTLRVSSATGQGTTVRLAVPGG